MTERFKIKFIVFIATTAFILICVNGVHAASEDNFQNISTPWHPGENLDTVTEKPLETGYIGLGGAYTTTTIGFDSDSFEDDFTEQFLSLFAEGGYWLTPYPYVGIGASYERGFPKFNFKFGSIDEELNASTQEISLSLMARYAFAEKALSPKVVFKVGYEDFRFTIEDHDPEYLTDNIYNGVRLDLDATIPIHPLFGVITSFTYFPFLSYSESSDITGSSSKMSGFNYQGDAGFYFSFNDTLSLELLYKLTSFHVDFSGDGVRAGKSVEDAKLSEAYQNFGVILKYNIY